MDAIAHPRPRSRQTVYTRIQAVKHAAELRPALRCLLRSIADYCGSHDECWPSVARLAEECGITPRYCRQLLRQLEQLGWIEHRPRFRSDGSQTSSVLAWTHEEPAEDKAPGTPVPPPRNSSSSLEASRENSGNEEHAGMPECVPDEDKSSKATRRTSPRYVTIDNNKITDPEELRRVYEHAAAAKLIDKSEATRLAFCAAWCAVSRRYREGTVHSPGGTLQFLLRNPAAMREYASQCDEDKARKAVRRLWPAPAYCPHG